MTNPVFRHFLKEDDETDSMYHPTAKEMMTCMERNGIVSDDINGLWDLYYEKFHGDEHIEPCLLLDGKQDFVYVMEVDPVDVEQVMLREKFFDTKAFRIKLDEGGNIVWGPDGYFINEFDEIPEDKTNPDPPQLSSSSSNNVPPNIVTVDGPEEMNKTDDDCPSYEGDPFDIENKNEIISQKEDVEPPLSENKNEIKLQPKRILNQTLVRHRKRTYQHQTYTHTRTILRNTWRNKVATYKDTIRKLHRRIQILRIIR